MSTYTHKVASLTRTSGTLAPWLGSLPALGNGRRGALAEQAERLAQAVNTLYLDGKGFFATNSLMGA